MTIQNKIIVILGGLVLLMGIVGGVLLHNYLNSRQEAANQAAELKQNQAAYQQALVQKADSIQNLAATVLNLNTTVTKAQRNAGYWQAVAQNLQVQIDTVGSKGQGVSASGEDATGKYAQVQFGPDHRGIVTISGFTKYYFTTPVQTTYSWQADFDEFDIQNSLYQDVDGLWKIKTVTRAPGVKFKADNKIDSSIYIGMRQTVEGELARAKHYLPSFGLRFKAGVGMQSTIKIASGTNTGFTTNQLMFDGSAEAYYRNYSLTYYPTWGVWSVGVNYTLDVSSLLESIF